LIAIIGNQIFFICPKTFGGYLKKKIVIQSRVAINPTIEKKLVVNLGDQKNSGIENW
jgi:hypothetical protein